MTEKSYNKIRVLVAETDDVNDLIYLATKHRPDVTLVDLQLSDCSDTGHISKLVHRHPQTKVPAFSDCINPQINSLALHAGAVGLISKYHPLKSLLQAITAIHAGETWFGRDTIEPGRHTHSTPDLFAQTQNDSNSPDQPKFSNCERSHRLSSEPRFISQRNQYNSISRKKPCAINYQQSIEKSV